MTPLDKCIVSSVSAADPVRKQHISKINLDHIPLDFKARYCSLLERFSDVFSRSDLDIGHCQSLPHVVRLRDPNKTVSINQYRLPHHLKEVAIDYVQKLLAAGVVRKSTSVLLIVPSCWFKKPMLIQKSL